MIIFLTVVGFLFFLWLFALSRYVTEDITKETEIEDLKKHIQHLQDTLDHYGMRMSNKPLNKKKLGE